MLLWIKLIANSVGLLFDVLSNKNGNNLISDKTHHELKFSFGLILCEFKINILRKNIALNIVDFQLALGQ
jgi:hypothetical protein